ncbi:unnamed protein product [Nezara viridula]|uniref:Uncharacterized protein n=1 Tax=Nezara viridula TaxID=85310 RepID=A0A9P0H7B5_NEZVI|nr:unnamed protein product [Nezara viridula]
MKIRPSKRGTRRRNGKEIKERQEQRRDPEEGTRGRRSWLVGDQPEDQRHVGEVPGADGGFFVRAEATKGQGISWPPHSGISTSLCSPSFVRGSSPNRSRLSRPRLSLHRSSSLSDGIPVQSDVSQRRSGITQRRTSADKVPSPRLSWIE